jgi:hypothetical protein
LQGRSENAARRAAAQLAIVDPELRVEIHELSDQRFD